MAVEDYVISWIAQNLCGATPDCDVSATVFTHLKADELLDALRDAFEDYREHTHGIADTK